jgi:hypothetical protein
MQAEVGRRSRPDDIVEANHAFTEIHFGPNLPKAAAERAAVDGRA